jgi:hypothetical protein
MRGCASWPLHDIPVLRSALPRLTYVQLPEWVVGFLFPAQHYMRRRRDEYFQDLRRGHDTAQPQRAHPRNPAQEGAEGAGDDPLLARARALRDHRLTTIGNIARDQDELLRAKAGELERTGAAEIVTAAGTIHARITRFRWGDDVIEITRSRGTGQQGQNGGTLARAPQPARTAAITRQLAQALAALEPRPLS